MKLLFERLKEKRRVWNTEYYVFLCTDTKYMILFRLFKTFSDGIFWKFKQEK